MRRLILAAACIALLAEGWVLLSSAQPAQAGGEVVTAFQTTTTYAGEYVFDYHFQEDYYNPYPTVASMGFDAHDVFIWTDVRRELIEPYLPGHFKDTIYRNVVARGTRTISNYDNGAGTSGSASCTISDDGKGEQLVTQQDLTGVPTIDPLVTVAWQLPEDVGPPVGPAGGRLRETGSSTGDMTTDPPCPDAGPYFLGYTLEEPCNQCVNTVPVTGSSTAAWGKAWDGSATVHLHTLVKGFVKPIHVELTWSKTYPPAGVSTGSIDQGYVQIDSVVSSTFTQIKMDVRGQLPPPLPKDCVKLLGPLWDHMWQALTGTGLGPVPLGPHDKVLLPLAPTCKGTVKLDVSGTVVPSSHAPDDPRAGPSAWAATARTLLASTGRVHTKPSWGSPTVTLKLTSAGARLLSGSHPAINAAGTLTVAPAGHRAITITAHGTIPASSG
jgi:hypothetical protein